MNGYGRSRREEILWAFLCDDVYGGTDPSFDVTNLRRGIPARGRMIELMVRQPSEGDG